MTLTTNLLRRRPRLRPSIYRNFSSSSDNHSNDAVSSQPNSSFSSYLTDVKASLSKQAPPNTKRPFSPSSNPNPPPKISSSGEIRKNLSEFRRLSAPPPPPTPTPTPTPSNISFQELYKRNVASKSGEGARKVTSFDAIRESLKNLQSKNQDTIGSRQLNGSTSTPFFPSFTGNIDSKTLTGEGGQSLPWHIFGKEVEGKDNEGEGGVDDALKFVRPYNYEDLGNKLMNLRPEKKKDERNWFSLQELSERLQKLRVNDEKEMEAAPKNLYTELRASLAKTVKSDEKRTNVNLQRIDMLNNLGAEQDFMLSPPKEHLVEKYFHPDNMSSAEKLKIELKKVRDEFKMSESDCGSARVQVAQLTTKIKHLSTALHKKDKHSRKGLQAMVQQRKKLLKYLRRTDWDSYCLVLSKLGLRDKADYKN